MNERDPPPAPAGRPTGSAADAPIARAPNGGAAAPAPVAGLGAALRHGVVRCADIAAVAHLAGSRFCVLNPGLAADGAALRGRYVMARLRSGLVLHATDASDIHDLTTQVVHGEGLTASLFLEGMADVSFGGRAFRFGPGTGRALEGVLMSRTEPDLFERRGRRGARVRKVNVSIPFSWLETEGLEPLEGHGAVLGFSRRHLASARWRPSPRLVALAEQMLAPPVLGPLLGGLYLESRALEIVSEALGALGDAAAPGPALAPRDQRRMWTVHDFIEARLDRDLTLDEIAREAGMSVNTLQRAFRGVFGATVFEYVRRRKLERARDALSQEGLSVSEAAYRAGYNSSANFATAFKRAFGVTPKAARGRRRGG